MKKYLYLARLYFQEYLVYRLSFFLWRIRNLVEILALVFFWLAIYGEQTVFLGYKKKEMLTYIVGIAFLKGIVLASRTANLAGHIKSGKITDQLIKPWGVFKFYFARDLVDKGFNLFFALIEIGLVFYFFKFSFLFPSDLWVFFSFVITSTISFFLYFFLSFWISTFSFWVDQPWAPRWLFGVVCLEFLAGAFFPLDVLPSIVAKIASFTPFPYLVYFPLKIWLGQVAPQQVIKVIMISLFWLVVFWFVSKKTWEKGLKNYSSYGG